MLKIKRQVMNTYAVKNQAIQSRLTASSQKNNVSAPARWIDNRPEAAQIRQLQALANDHVAQHQPPVQRKEDKKELPTTGDTLAKLMVSSFMPTAMRNLALNDKNTWRKIKVFSNKQPQNLRNEIKTYKHQLREDKGQSFIVSYKNKNKFERRLNQGESFLWVFTVDQDLIIGSKKTTNTR